MPDHDRLLYSLAGALLATDWSLPALRAALRQPSLHPGKLPERLLAAFVAKPDFHQAVAFLHADLPLNKALAQPPILRRLKLKPSRRPAQMHPLPARLANLRIPSLITESELADWLGVDIRHLQWFADIAGRNRKHPRGPLRTYRYRWIPKPHGSSRLLEIPKATLKQIQRRILEEILNHVPIHPAAHGFAAGRSTLTNAAPHCGQKAVLRFDLTDFFPSISAARVHRIFRTLGYPVGITRLLTGLCSTMLPAAVWEARPGAQLGADFLERQKWITRHLPQGAPTSPALANLAALRLDRRLFPLAQKAGFTYTRYADDLTFSGGDALAQSRDRLAVLVAVIARDEGFAINHRKTRLMRAGVRQHVTGIVVNVRPNIQRSDFDRLKAILTNCARHGPAAQNRDSVLDFRAHLAGRVAHMASIHSARGQKLQKLLERIVW